MRNPSLAPPRPFAITKMFGLDMTSNFFPIIYLQEFGNNYRSEPTLIKGEGIDY